MPTYNQDDIEVLCNICDNRGIRATVIAHYKELIDHRHGQRKTEKECLLKAVAVARQLND